MLIRGGKKRKTDNDWRLQNQQWISHWSIPLLRWSPSSVLTITRAHYKKTQNDGILRGVPKNSAAYVFFRVSTGLLVTLSRSLLVKVIRGRSRLQLSGKSPRSLSLFWWSSCGYICHITTPLPLAVTLRIQRGHLAVNASWYWQICGPDQLAWNGLG